MLHDRGRHLLLDEMSNINFTQLDVQYIRSQAGQLILKEKIEKLKELGGAIANLDDNSVLVNEFNAKLLVAYNQVRFIEQAQGLKSNALGALSIVKMKIIDINPPAVTAELPVESIAVKITPPKKPKVYTPRGMFATFKELGKEFNVKNYQAKTKNLAIDRRALNAGRANRSKQPDKVHPMDEPAHRELQIKALNRELKNVDKFVDALADLKQHQPPPNSDYYDTFVMRYNKFAGGINHHLQGMLKAAMKLEDTEALQQAISNAKVAFIAPVVSAMVEERIEISSGNRLPAIHEELLQLGLAIRNANDPTEAKSLSAQLAERVGASHFDINAQDVDGNTLLHKAIELGCKGLVSALMNNSTHQPDIHLENKNGDTPLKLANRIMLDDRNAWQDHLRNNPSADPTKSTSRSEQIYKLVNPTTRRQAENLKRLTITSNAEQDNDLTLGQLFTKKYLNNFTKINTNLGNLDAGHVLHITVNSNYKHHNKDVNRGIVIHNEFAKPELTKIFNPLLAINTALAFANMGIKTLIDKACNKIADVGAKRQTSTPVATVLKAIFTFPISAVQVVVGGVGDLISHAINKVADATKGSAVPSHRASLSNADSLDLIPLDDAPSERRDSKFIIAATHAGPIAKSEAQLVEKVEVAVAAPLREQPQPNDRIAPEPPKSESFKPR